MHGPNRDLVMIPAHDPVEPDLAWFMGPSDKVTVALSEFVEGGGAAADDFRK